MHQSTFAKLAAATALLTLGAPGIANDHKPMGVKTVAMADLKADPDLMRVIADARRAEDAQRDRYRHPAETLSFFGVEPDDTVVEYSPGGGWYSKVIAPYVMERGRFVGLQFNPDPLPIGDEFKTRVRAFPTDFPKTLAEYTGQPATRFPAYLSGSVPEEMNGTVDYVIIPRMMHNLFRWNVADSELKQVRTLLKDGGMVGIVQHRAKDDAPYSYTDGNKGYLKTDQVVNLMQAHGFELVAQTEVNANPNDTADYEKGVWTLPPNFAEGDAEKARYAGIGESDRMTLLFRKLD